MIAGVGTDLVDVNRINEKIAKESGFRELVFSSAEIAYCESKAKKAEHYAARFAAKEAFLKAIGTGWKNGTAFNEIEINNDASGKPGIALLGETANTLASVHIKKIWISLSHVEKFASAVVIIEKIDG